MARERTIKAGTYCEKTVNPRRSITEGSLRWKQSGKAWLLVGCPRGKWKSRKERCSVGTRAYKLLVPKRANRKCPRGTRRIVKG